MQIIITSPSLDPTKNVSGVSAVTQFIIDNNTEQEYVHFELGRRDGERGGFFRINAILVALIAWVKLLRKYPKAIIHYNFPLERPSILRDPMFMQIARWMERKMVVHIHGGVFLTNHSVPTPYKQILQHVFSWDIPFILLSNKEKDILQSKFGIKHAISLPNCIDLRDAAICEKIHKGKEEPIVLGYLGRIAETKGIDYLLDACRILRDKGINFVLKLAGTEEKDGKYLPVFSEVLDKQFEYCGIVSGKNKYDFLRSLDLFVLPSYFEGLPISLLECMSYGVVPIVTPVGSIPEVVTDRDNGIFVKVKDADTIVHAIIQLSEDYLEMQRLSHNAKETIFKRFNPASYTKLLNIVYKQSNI